MRVAALQFRPPKGDPVAARRTLAAMVDEAGRLGARLIVAPEMATTGYLWSSVDELLPHAEPADGESCAVLAALAGQHKAWVVVGYPELDPSTGLLYNAALVLSPEGRRAASYRKVLLYDADKPWAQAGTRRLSFEAELGRMAPAICMDMNDDGLLLFLMRQQVQVLAFSTSWVEEGLDVWRYWRGRLRGWPGCLVAADNWGEDRGTRFAGRSVIMGPGGVVLASAGPEGDAVVVADLSEP